LLSDALRVKTSWLFFAWIHPLPSLLRFLAIIAMTVGVVYGAMVAIVAAVQPTPREMSFTIPPQRLNR
jgi:hypothetical protein